VPPLAFDYFVIGEKSITQQNKTHHKIVHNSEQEKKKSYPCQFPLLEIIEPPLELVIIGGILKRDRSSRILVVDK